MNLDPISLFEQLAENGTAPQVGCTLLGVGYEDAFERLQRKYIQDAFSRGRSAEKFIVGPYGSGKTHFLREMMERAEKLDCTTAEVALTKRIDFCDSLLVYQEIAREVRAPGSELSGMRAFLTACANRVRSRASEEMSADALLQAWADNLPEANFELESFARVAKLGIEALIRGDDEQLQSACKWLEGDVTERSVAKIVSESPISGNERSVHAVRARLSLFQLNRHAGFQGIVAGFDEAEQSFAVDKKRMARIFSLLLADLNALASLANGSALILYAVTPDVLEKVGEQLPALMQRLRDATPERDFLAGSTMSPIINLTLREDPEADLRKIGERLVTVFYDLVTDAPANSQGLMREQLPEIAKEIASAEASSSARREFVKRVAEELINQRDQALGTIRPVKPATKESEF